jgi:hypothetical protein
MLRLLGLLLLLSVFSSSVYAQEQPVPEDPTENWCFAGGAWGDGRCTVIGNVALTEWYWTAGYYRAAAEAGRMSILDIPETYRPQIDVAMSASDIVCTALLPSFFFTVFGQSRDIPITFDVFSGSVVENANFIWFNGTLFYKVPPPAGGQYGIWNALSGWSIMQDAGRGNCTSAPTPPLP